jgi:hypothetical protein
VIDKHNLEFSVGYAEKSSGSLTDL